MTEPISALPSAVAALIFSKDRPLQLEAALSSWARHCQDVSSVAVTVLYKASTPSVESFYRRVAQEHPMVQFAVEKSFRADVLGLLHCSEYVVLVVDDTVFIRDFTAMEMVRALKRNADMLGFSMRLGRNTTYSYSMNHAQGAPDFAPMENGRLKYRWPEAEYDFGYPLEVSSSIYRSAEMLELLQQVDFKNPNTLELAMARNAKLYRNTHPWLGCWIQSRAFSIPANKVQQIFENRAGTNEAYSAEALAALFTQGQRIQTEAFDNFIPNACHQEMELKTAPGSEPRPLVTVVIPCYKQAHFLAEAVESVVAQTFNGWELVIVNDGSPDNTSEVAHDLIKKFPEQRIRLIEKQNEGLAAARNTGIEAGVGEYFLPLDADDKIAPAYLRQTVAILQSQPKVGFVYSHIRHFGLQTGVYPLPPFDADTMVHKDNIGCVCSLVRRTAWQQAGKYAVGMRAIKEGYEDWDLWIGCIAAGWAGHRIPSPLFFYRKREGSMLSEATAAVRTRLIAYMVLKHRPLYSAERIQRAELEAVGKPVPHAPKRILIACTHFWPSVGGVETIVENLGAWLARRGHEVTVATTSREDRHFFLRGGMDIIDLPPKKIEKKKRIRFHPKLRELAASGQYDACVLFADPQNWVLWSLENLTVPPEVRRIAQPLINAEGHSNWKDKPEFCQRLKSLLTQFESVVAISKAGTEVKYFRETGIPFAYIPNAADAGPGDAGAFRQKFAIPDGQCLLLHIANLAPVKNHLALMRSLAYLPGDWRLVMIGHPTEDSKYYEEVRAAAAMDRRFLLIPGLPHPEIADAVNAADFVLLASLGEVSPVALLEAMSRGKPWLATPECGAALDNAGGVIAPLSKFAETLQKLMERPSLAQSLGRLGEEHWRACFSWDRVGAGWEELIFTGKITDDFAMPPALRENMTALIDQLNSMAPSLPPSGPKVSVIIPTCNRPSMLVEAVRSVLNQTLTDFEIMVVNDGGVDVAHLLAPLDSQGRVRCLAHEIARGPAAARNTGLLAARGRYIAYLDDDDIFFPTHLETLATCLDAQGGGVAYTEAECAHQNLVNGNYVTVNRTIPYSSAWDTDLLLVQNIVPTLCLMHDRATGIAAGAFDEELSTHEDWDFWIRLSYLSTPVHIKKITCEFRSREDGSSMTGNRRADFLRTAKMVYEKHKGRVAGKAAVRRRQQRVLGRLERELGIRNKIFSRGWFGQIFRGRSRFKPV